MAKILVVEDDERVLRVLQRALVTAGHDVVLAADGAEALRHVVEAAPDLVVTDLIMPNVEGLQLLRELRQRPHPPKVLAISGGGAISAGDYLEMALILGADATLSKPFLPQELVDTVARVLKQ